MRPILQLKCDMVHSIRLAPDEIHSVMVRAAPQKCKEIADSIRFTEPKHVDIKAHDFIDIGDTKGDVTKLFGCDAARLRLSAADLPLNENLEIGALGILEIQARPDCRMRVMTYLRTDTLRLH